jgi:hypothetical protein
MSAGLVLNRTRQVPAEDTPAFGAIAERFRRGGDLERAVALCRDGLAKFPNHMSARVTLGWALLDLGKYDDAQAELEQVLRRAPDNLAAIRGLAQLHERAENAVMLPLDGPGAWPPEAETIESAASAAAEASAADASVAPAEPVKKEEESVGSAADLIVTGRAPAVEVPASFAPVALTSAAEMTSAVPTPEIAAPVATVVEAVAKAAEPAKRGGLLPIQMQPSRVVRPQTFESVVDDEMPVPQEPAAAAQAPKLDEAAKSDVIVAAPDVAAAVAPTTAPVVEAVAIASIQTVAEAAEPHASVAPAVVGASFAASTTVEPVVNEPVADVSTFARASEPVVDEAVADVSTFALASDAIVDEPIAASGLTGFAGEAEFALEPVLDDYIAPPADAISAAPEFALAADAPELQQPLSLEDAAQALEHAEAQPLLQSVLDEPVAPAAPVEFASILDQLASRGEAAVEAAAVEPFVEAAEAVSAEPVIQAAVEAPVADVVAHPAIEPVVDVEVDATAFHLTAPVASDLIAAEQGHGTELEEVALVPEGVLAFDFETPAPVVEPEPVVVAEIAKPVLAEVVSIAARRNAARLVVLERFLNRVEARRTEVAAQLLAG